MASWPGNAWGGGYGMQQDVSGYGGQQSYGGGYSNGGGGRKRGRDNDDGYGKRQRLDIDSALPERTYRPRGRWQQKGNYGRNDLKEMLSVAEKYQIDLWRFGDEVPGLSTEESSKFQQLSLESLEGLKTETADMWTRGNKEDVLKGFRIAIAECPHKLPHYAALLALLAREAVSPSAVAKPPAVATNGDAVANGDEEMQTQTPTTPAPVAVNVGIEVVKDLIKTLQSHLDARRWRSARFTLQFFAVLASLPQPLIDITSLLTLLQQSFVSTLETDLALRADRGDEIVRIVLETLLRLRPELRSGDIVMAIGNGLQNYMASRKLDVGYLGGDSGNVEQWHDPLAQLYQALVNNMESANGVLPLPEQIATALAEPVEATVQACEMPSVSLPLEVEGETVIKAAEPAAPGSFDADFAKDLTGYAGTRVCLSFFSDDSIPAQDTVDGVLLRQLISDIISVFEVNRKDCARILLKDLNKWLVKGTFKSATDSAEDAALGRQWNLESLIMEVVLSHMFSRPNSPHRAAFYQSLVGELCKVSPQTVAPALGKCIRKLYSGLGAAAGGIDEDNSNPTLGPDGLRKFAEWFAIHLSNFGFHWRWPEWEGDLTLEATHPKKVFISRVFEMEIRLSYYDRIKTTLPESYTSAEAGVYPREAPSHEFTYEVDGRSPYQTQAGEVMRMMRSRATAQEIKDYLDQQKKDAVAGEIGDEPISEEAAESLAKDMVFQCMLVIGSRSFSHFLNILERYIALLREFTSSAFDRAALLRTTSRFWTRNSQFCLIVFDKLLQYRIVDPIDMVSWIFEGEQETLDGPLTARNWADITSWDVLRLTVEKVQTRAKNATARLEQLRKREENKKDAERAAAAGDPIAMEGAETTPAEAAAEAPAEDTGAAEVAAVEKQLANIKKEQASMLVEILRRFHATFTAFDTEASADAWTRWFAQGWFAEFCRLYANDIYEHLNAIAMVEVPTGSLVFQGVQGAQQWVEFA